MNTEQLPLSEFYYHFGCYVKRHNVMEINWKIQYSTIIVCNFKKTFYCNVVVDLLKFKIKATRCTEYD